MAIVLLILGATATIVTFQEYEHAHGVFSAAQVHKSKVIAIASAEEYGPWLRSTSPPDPFSQLNLDPNGLGISRDVMMIALHRDDGSESKPINLGTKNWSYIGSIEPDKLLFIANEGNVTYDALVIDTVSEAIWLETQYDGSPGSPTMVCGKKAYAPYRWGFWEVPEMYEISGVDGSSTVIQVPWYEGGPEQSLEIRPLGCLGDGRLVVRTIEGIHPNNIATREDMLYLYSPDSKAFQRLTQPKHSEDAEGYESVRVSEVHSDTFYTYERRGTKDRSDKTVTHTIEAFRDGALLWSRPVTGDIGYTPGTIGPEVDGIINVGVHPHQPREGWSRSRAHQIHTIENPDEFKTPPQRRGDVEPEVKKPRPSYSIDLDIETGEILNIQQYTREIVR